VSDDRRAPPPVAIDYPTLYTFKAIGPAGNVRARMLELIARVLGPVDDGAVSVRPSKTGKYESVSAQVQLRSEEERRRIYESFYVALTVEKIFVWYV
jgi:putative lipoic acid-binding regulatory protein